MIHTFDKKIDTKNYTVSLIPIKEGETASDYIMTYLSYPISNDYKQMSYDEIRDYITNYYNDVLSKLDPEKILRDLRSTILVSDERTDSLAIRHIVSEWLNLLTDEPVYECDIIDGHLIPLERPNFIRPILEEAIKNSKVNMKGFKSVRALYLFEKGEAFEKEGLKAEAICYKNMAYTAERKYEDKIKVKSYKNSRKYVRKSRDISEI